MFSEQTTKDRGNTHRFYQASYAKVCDSKRQEDRVLNTSWTMDTVVRHHDKIAIAYCNAIILNPVEICKNDISHIDVVMELDHHCDRLHAILVYIFFPKCIKLCMGTNLSSSIYIVQCNAMQCPTSIYTCTRNF